MKVAAKEKSAIKAERELLKKQRIALQNELINELLKRANLTKKDIYESALKRWTNKNLDLLTPSELKKYQQILL